MGNVLNMNTKLAMTKLVRLSKGLSRMEQLQVKFGHLMQEDTAENEYEK